MANGLRAGFQRFIHRSWPEPVGSRDQQLLSSGHDAEIGAPRTSTSQRTIDLDPRTDGDRDARWLLRFRSLPYGMREGETSSLDLNTLSP